jgi:hypothetical protein
MSGSIIDEARRESIRQGWDYVLNTAVLLAIARQRGPASTVLAQLGATEDSLAQTFIGAGDVSGPPTDDVVEAVQAPNAPEVVDLLARAESFALGLSITDEAVALLLGLAYDRYGTHVPALRRLGVERSAIVAHLAGRGIAVPSMPPPPDLPELTDSVILPRKQARVVIGELVQMAASDPGRVFDSEGGGRWAYGAVAGSPGMTRILATPDLGLPAIVDQSLTPAGTATPPKGAGNSQRPG